MLTKSPTVLHIEDVPAGSLFYYPELGEGVLCLAARFDGQQEGRATMVVQLSSTASDFSSPQLINIDTLYGRAALVEDFRAEVDLSTASMDNDECAHVGKDGTYIMIRSNRPMMRQCVRLEDGVIRSSPPSHAIAFKRWAIVSVDDRSEELWSSQCLEDKES